MRGAIRDGRKPLSRHTVIPDAGHEIHLFRPEVVIQAIQDVIRAVNSPTHQLANSPIR